MILPSKEFLEIFKKTPGALSVCESIAIMNITSEAPEGALIELGTHKGKSAMSAMVGYRHANYFYLVEPEFKNEMWLHVIYDRLRMFNINLTIIPIADISINEIPKHDNYSYVFIDSGSHGDGLPLQEVKLLEDRMVERGIIAFHDYKSQFKEVEQAYNYLIDTGKYEPININWTEIIDYVKDNDL